MEGKDLKFLKEQINKTIIKFYNSRLSTERSLFGHI